MRSAVPAVEGDSAIAVIAAAETKIKQKHRKMFYPLSIRQKSAFGKRLFAMVSFPCDVSSGPYGTLPMRLAVTGITHPQVIDSDREFAHDQ
jgi:hypothetical protein